MTADARGATGSDGRGRNCFSVELRRQFCFLWGRNFGRFQEERKDWELKSAECEIFLFLFFIQQIYSARSFNKNVQCFLRSVRNRYLSEWMLRLDVNQMVNIIVGSHSSSARDNVIQTALSARIIKQIFSNLYEVARYTSEVLKGGDWKESSNVLQFIFRPSRHVEYLSTRRFLDSIECFLSWQSRHDKVAFLVKNSSVQIISAFNVDYTSQRSRPKISVQYICEFNQFIYMYTALTDKINHVWASYE